MNRMKLIEECAGIGQLLRDEQPLGTVDYRISRFQGLMESGLPVPGRFRIDGTIGLDKVEEPERWLGADLTLRLADGRSLGITLADPTGRVLAEGHGPKRGCGCC